MVIVKLFAGVVNSHCLFCEHLAVNHFILKLDVSKLVFQLGWVRSFDHLRGWCKSHFKYQVSVQGLRIENAVVSQDLMIQIDAIFFP